MSSSNNTSEKTFLIIALATVAVVIMGILFLVLQNSEPLLSQRCDLCTSKNHEISAAQDSIMIYNFNLKRSIYLADKLDLDTMYLPATYVRSIFSVANTQAINFVFIIKDNKLGLAFNGKVCDRGTLKDATTNIGMVTNETDFTTTTLSTVEPFVRAYNTSQAYSNDSILSEFFCKSFYDSTIALVGITGYNIFLGEEHSATDTYKTAILRPVFKSGTSKISNKVFESAYPCPPYCN